MPTILEWGPLSRVRRNHALEHATLQVLAEHNPTLRMAGYSDTGGFWLLGDVPSEQVDEAVHQALARLEGGEHNLAVHPNCGTNFVTAGFLAGTLGWLSMLGARNTRDKLERWPMIVSLVTIALILAQPLGLLLQARVTTEAEMGGLQVSGIQRQQRGRLPVHRVFTQG